MGEADWLNRYVDPGCGLPECERVHRGDGLAAVTDRKCILAVDDPGAGFAELEPRPNNPGVNRVFRASLLEPAPADAFRLDLHDLWLWLDRIDAERCPECRDYSDAHRGFCQDCDGLGWVRPDGDFDADTVVLAGLPVDRWRLAWWLPGELEPLGTAVSVWRNRAFPSGSVLTLDGGRWRLVTQTLDPTDRRGKVYRTYHPGAGLWWQHRRDPVARLSARDWFADRGVEMGETALFGSTADDLP